MYRIQYRNIELVLLLRQQVGARRLGLMSSCVMCTLYFFYRRRFIPSWSRFWEKGSILFKATIAKYHLLSVFSLWRNYFLHFWNEIQTRHYRVWPIFTWCCLANWTLASYIQFTWIHPDVEYLFYDPEQICLSVRDKREKGDKVHQAPIVF